MGIFKVRNCDRSLKKFVVCDTTLSSLKEKAAEKLMVKSDGCKIVLECDGTDIEDDEVLSELRSEIFLFLEAGQVWARPDSANSNNGVKERSATSEQSVADMPAVDSISSSSLTPPSQPYAVLAEQQCIQAEIQKADLPEFTSDIAAALEAKKIESVWGKMTTQLATYCYQKWPQMDEKSHYAVIGEKMYRKWPCIAQESGLQPWSFLVKQISQKIRHKRLAEKQKGEKNSVGCSSPPPPKKGRLFRTHVQQVLANSDDTEAHLEALTLEFKKQRKNQKPDHIKMLLESTQNYRQDLLKCDDNGSLNKVLDKFPCLRDGVYICYAFAVQFRSDRLVAMSSNLTKFRIAVQDIANMDPQDSDLNLSDVLKYVEREVQYDRGQKVSKSMSSIVEMKEGIADEDIESSLESNLLDPPRLVAFHEGDVVKGMFILADGNIIKAFGSSVHSGITQLLSSYYIFDLNYPRCFAMVLAALQIFVMGEPYSHKKKGGDVSKKFLFFIKKLRPIFDNVQLPED